jgi:hypothetical protein
MMQQGRDSAKQRTAAAKQGQPSLLVLGLPQLLLQLLPLQLLWLGPTQQTVQVASC